MHTLNTREKRLCTMATRTCICKMLNLNIVKKKMLIQQKLNKINTRILIQFDEYIYKMKLGIKY